MLDFVHNKVQTLEGMIVSFNQVQQLLGNRTFTFESEYEAFQKTLLNYLESTGNSSKESEVQKNYNMLITVRKGFDPVRLEKITTGKRDVFWGFAFHTSENIQKILQELYNKEIHKLEDAEEILSNMMLNLFQAKVITKNTLKGLNTMSAIEKFWLKLAEQNDSIALMDKKLKLQLIAEDIYIILEKIIAKFR